MASTNKTANLQLNQWVGTDPVLMADFNADNQKLDAAVTALQAGSIKIATGSYTGTGTAGVGNKTSLTFDFPPKVLIIQGVNDAWRGGMAWLRGVERVRTEPSNTSQAFVNVTWSGNTVSWYNDNYAWAQYNELDYTYLYYALG